MFRQILLVRHAMPIVLPDRPPASWPLGAEGNAAATALVEQIRPFNPDLVIASTEVKAIGTANAIASGLGLDSCHVSGFGEQGGDGIPFIVDPEELRETVQRHFEAPDRAIFGLESSCDAGRRFTAALDSLRDRFPHAVRPLVVSHGRIMTTFLGELTGQDPWNIWRELTFPDLLLVDLDARCFEPLR